MPWVKVDDTATEHPKIAGVGPLGLAMWVAGLAYCNRNLTDGFIPAAKARTLIDWTQTDGNGVCWQIGLTLDGSLASRGIDVTSDLVIETLVDAGAWHEVNGGYEVHDYLDYQPSREQVEREREEGKRRAAKSREKRSAKVRPNFAVTSGDPVPVPVPQSESKDSPWIGEIGKVWDAYLKHHPSAKLTRERRDLIGRRIKAYPVEVLVAAIEGNHRSPYHCGENPGGKKYHDLGLILRDADKIERFAELATQPIERVGRTVVVPRLSDCDVCGGQGYLLEERSDGEVPVPCAACRRAA